MSTDTDTLPLRLRPTDAEIVECLLLAALGKLDAERATDIASRLTAHSAARAAAGRLHGAKGGRPKGVSAWYKVLDEEGDEAWSRDLAALGDYLGITKGSLQAYLNRGRGKYQTTVQRDGREVLFSVCYATDTEKERLNAADPAVVPMWEPPVVATRQRKTLAR